MASHFHNSGHAIAAWVGAALLGAGPVAAQEPAAQEPEVDVDHLEVTMRLLPEGATGPDPVTRVIELPVTLQAEIVEEASRPPTDSEGPSRGAGRQADPVARHADAAFLPAQNTGASVRDVAAQRARSRRARARQP